MKQIATCLLLTIGFFSSAQSYIFNEVKKFRKSNFGTIYNDDEVRGYYLFNKAGKAKGRSRIFDITILDPDLQVLAEEQLAMDKLSVLIETAFNGQYLLFKFFNPKKRAIEYRILDQQGNMTTRRSRKIKSSEWVAYDNMLEEEDQENTVRNLYSASSSGFVDIYPIRKKGLKYAITYISNDGFLEWTYTPKITREVKIGDFLISSEEEILILETVGKQLSKDPNFYIKALDFNGAELYTVPLITPQYKLQPHNAFFDPESGNFVFIGDYYSKFEKIYKSESMGIFLMELDSEGRWVKEEYLMWDKDIQPLMSKEDRAALKGYNIFFHNVVRMNDGTLLAIGESYKKVVSALGVAGLLSGRFTGKSMADFTIGGMVLIEITPEIVPKQIYYVNKGITTVLMNAGMGLINTHALAKYMQIKGYFDYAYTQQSDHSVTVAFTNRVKISGKIFNKDAVRFVTYSDDTKAFSEQGVLTKTKAKELFISPAKEGYFAVIEFFKKKDHVRIQLRDL